MPRASIIAVFPALASRQSTQQRIVSVLERPVVAGGSPEREDRSSSRASVNLGLAHYSCGLCQSRLGLRRDTKRCSHEDREAPCIGTSSTTDSDNLFGGAVPDANNLIPLTRADGISGSVTLTSDPR
jgi:hypothetical protein